ARQHDGLHHRIPEDRGGLRPDLQPRGRLRHLGVSRVSAVLHVSPRLRVSPGRGVRDRRGRRRRDLGQCELGRWQRERQREPVQQLQQDEHPEHELPAQRRSPPGRGLQGPGRCEPVPARRECAVHAGKVAIPGADPDAVRRHAVGRDAGGGRAARPGFTFGIRHRGLARRRLRRRGRQQVFRAGRQLARKRKPFRPRRWKGIPMRPVATAIAFALASSLVPIPSTARPVQETFASPELAASALANAVRAADVKALLAVVGPDSKSWIFTGDEVADRTDWKTFLDAYDRKNRIEKQGDAKAILALGDGDWPFPAPLVMKNGRWAFDAQAGREEVLNRRIGSNELGAIQTLYAIVDAQRTYAATDADGNGMPDYAARFISTPGKKDGLYWDP